MGGCHIPIKVRVLQEDSSQDDVEKRVPTHTARTECEYPLARTLGVRRLAPAFGLLPYQKFRL